MKKELRADQLGAIDGVREAMQETRRVVMQAPTGFGKTVVGADICKRVRSKDKRVLLTVPALSLVDQTVEAFFDQGIDDIGVIQANHHMTDLSKPVQIASIQTLIKRGLGNVHADVVLVDEVHKWFKFFEGWFAEERWRRVPIIGFSATPWTPGLGAWFDRLVVANTIEGMVADKTLAPFRTFAASHPDLEGVRINAGEYVQEDLAERAIKPKLIADIVETWKALGEGRPTVAFCISRGHAAQVAKEFEEAGIPSGYMDCDTPTGERRALRHRFLAGDIRVICNVDVLGLGCDWPEVSCISYCRPTRSEMRCVQNIGRGLRVAEGKTDLIIIDHSDTTRRLGFVTDIHYPELHDGRTRAKEVKGVELPKECPACHYMKPPRCAECPACGFKVEHHAKPVLVERGSLKEIKPEGRKRPEAAARFPNQPETYAMLLGYAQIYGKKPGLAYFKYKELYGNFPPNTMSPRNTEPLSPSDDLLMWIKSQNIRYAKGKERDRWNDKRETWPSGRPMGTNGHNGHDSGALSEREQAIIDRAREEFAGGSSPLMSEQDYEDMR